MTKDQVSTISIVQALPPASVSDNTAQVGNLVDGAGFESLTYAISAGSLADADVTFATTLQEGNASDGSDLAAVAATDLVGALPAITFASDNTNFKFGYVGGKRYTKLTITPANNTSAAFFAANAILGHPRHGPAA